MSILHQVLEAKIPEWREQTKSLVSEHADASISGVTVKQAFGGMRGVEALICDTSDVDPQEGVSIRGHPIRDLAEESCETVLFLLMTGQRPNGDQVARLRNDLDKRSDVPDYVWDVLRDLPSEMHPMSMISTALMACERESEFARQYDEGLPKDRHWEAILEDVLCILGRMPMLAAGTYRAKFGGTLPVELSPEANFDYAENLAGAIDPPNDDGTFGEALRLYLVMHCDHEGGNVSANTTTTVASALSNPYLALAAGLNGLAGPLHGRANQQCLRFVHELIEEFHAVPNDDELRAFVEGRLEQGRVIPGFGHAVLRATDPRFTALHEFGKTHCENHLPFQVVDRLYHVVPEVLKQQGKAKNPYPNVDAVSGSIMDSYGIREMSFYTVFFGVSRAMGLLSQVLMERAMMMPIRRPKSVTTDWIREHVGANADRSG
ncbi:MAG: citrate (Si)-synthase [Phycisphaeraceae bacterium]